MTSEIHKNTRPAPTGDNQAQETVNQIPDSSTTPIFLKGAGKARQTQVFNMGQQRDYRLGDPCFDITSDIHYNTDTDMELATKSGILPQTQQQVPEGISGRGVSNQRVTDPTLAEQYGEGQERPVAGITALVERRLRSADTGPLSNSQPEAEKQEQETESCTTQGSSTLSLPDTTVTKQETQREVPPNTPEPRENPRLEGGSTYNKMRTKGPIERYLVFRQIFVT